MDTVLRIDADYKNLAGIRDRVSQWARSHGADPVVVDGLILAVDESVTNIIMHGYCCGTGKIEIRLALEGEELVVRLLDQAPLFDPTTAPPPDLTLPLEQRAEGGLGVFLARHSVDSYSYRVTPEGKNELTLRKKRHRQNP